MPLSAEDVDVTGFVTISFALVYVFKCGRGLKRVYIKLERYRAVLPRACWFDPPVPITLLLRLLLSHVPSFVLVHLVSHLQPILLLPGMRQLPGTRGRCPRRWT